MTLEMVLEKMRIIGLTVIRANCEKMINPLVEPLASYTCSFSVWSGVSLNSFYATGSTPLEAATECLKQYKESVK